METSDMALAVIEEQADRTIRRVEIDGTWYFSVVDVIGLLTESTAPRQYWLDTKRRMQNSDGWKETSENLLQLPLKAQDGKTRLTDCATTETLLRIIQSVPSPKAEPVKQWLARVGAREFDQSSGTPPASPSPVIVEAVPATPIAAAWAEPPPTDGDLLGWAAWLEKLAVVYRQQAALESRVSYLEAGVRSHDRRLEDIEIKLDQLFEETHRSLPELLQLLHPETLSRPHQAAVRRWVTLLSGLTGWHINMIYQDLAVEFDLGSFSDASESDWRRIQEWFTTRIADARRYS